MRAVASVTPDASTTTCESRRRLTVKIRRMPGSSSTISTLAIRGLSVLVLAGPNLERHGKHHGSVQILAHPKIATVGASESSRNWQPQAGPSWLGGEEWLEHPGKVRLENRAA